MTKEQEFVAGVLELALKTNKLSPDDFGKYLTPPIMASSLSKSEMAAILELAGMNKEITQSCKQETLEEMFEIALQVNQLSWEKMLQEREGEKAKANPNLLVQRIDLSHFEKLILLAVKQTFASTKQNIEKSITEYVEKEINVE